MTTMSEERRTEMAKVMNLAWMIFRSTGESFSDSMKKAWRNRKLKGLLKKGSVEFTYRKVDGSIRKALGTLAEGVMPKYESHGRRARSGEVQVYYDLGKGKFKSFKKANLIAVAL